MASFSKLPHSPDSRSVRSCAEARTFATPRSCSAARRWRCHYKWELRWCTSSRVVRLACFLCASLPSPRLPPSPLPSSLLVSPGTKRGFSVFFVVWVMSTINDTPFWRPSIDTIAALASFVLGLKRCTLRVECCALLNFFAAVHFCCIKKSFDSSDCVGHERERTIRYAPVLLRVCICRPLASVWLSVMPCVSSFRRAHGLDLR